MSKEKQHTDEEYAFISESARNIVRYYECTAKTNVELVELCLNDIERLAQLEKNEQIKHHLSEEDITEQRHDIMHGICMRLLYLKRELGPGNPLKLFDKAVGAEVLEMKRILDDAILKHGKEIEEERRKREPKIEDQY